MYIYMGKRKPKLCRMKRLDVSPKITFFFLLKMNRFILSPSHSTFLITEKTDLLNLPFLLSRVDEIRLQKRESI